ncbi:MAG: dTDP-4-dehydrorhamnose reductase [Bacteroidales bacterium]|jgi:dTDP-4-dehydrorhamnose reductase|nr:dTDP-4-dehydrorhamnose reductase [Bacteroidales bacterium]
MAKILITGGEGQLGSAIKEASKEFSDLNLVFTDIDDFDITNAASVDEYLKTGDFDYLINCAAYTAVDKAEEEKGLAFLINATGPENLAKTCQKYNCRLVHISTDYVFDGRSHIPYIETMETNPPSVYGQSKLEGEKAILKHSKSAIILRTSWLYYEFGNNFLNTMIKLGAERDALGVVFDQIGTPTYARDFATSILKIITSNKISAKTEIYNYSNEGVISWYDFAKEIMEIANINCNIIPIESKEYPLPAPRPHYSVLNKSKIKSAFDLRIPYWKDSLKVCLKKLSEKSLTK